MSKLKDKVVETARNMAAAVGDVLRDEAAAARRDLVAAIWDGDARKAAECYRVLGEFQPQPLIEVAMRIIEAVPICQRFAAAGADGKAKSDYMKAQLAVMTSNPPKDADEADSWVNDCIALERKAHATYLAWTWREAAELYLHRLRVRFPALADHPRWQEADSGEISYPQFEAMQKLLTAASSEEFPTRIENGVLRSIAPPPVVQKRKALVRASMPT